MLNYRSASILTVILAVLVFLLMIIHPYFLWLLLPVIGLYLVLIIRGSARISSGFYLEALCKGGPEKILALTFDDGPDAKITPLVLDILDKHSINATFFLTGENAERHPDLARMIHSRGHILGNHSYSHSFFYDFSGRKTMERDLMQAERIIMDATGKRPLLFRPPYGVTTPVMAKIVRKLGYSVIGWSVRSLDTRIKDAERLAGRVIRKLNPGMVILMHDTQEVTPAALEKIIIKAKEDGYRFAGIEEMFGISL